jgi:uncharacterized protein YbaR (Trm112 family)
MDPVLLELVRCPRCGQRLRQRKEDSECAGCGTSFPEPAGIPALFPDPAKLVNEWRRGAQRFVELMEQSVAAMDEHLKRPDLLDSTSSRLQRTRDAHAANGARIAQLFADAGLAPDNRAKASDREFSLIEYYEQILRDWGWDDGAHRENAEAADLVAATMEAAPRLGRVLVLGTGPSRLAYDLHTRFAPDLTVALDMNPLLLLAARQVMFGEALALWEFPPDPRSLAAACVEHRLRAPAGPPQRFHLLLADAFSPPFADGSFDTVVTPWFIDIVPVDIRDTISLIYRLLAPGGRWLNYGPLHFPKEHSHAQRYSPEELYQLVQLGDFELSPPRVTALGYMNSPASARTRTSEVVTFSARKRQPQTASAPPPASGAPAWLLLSHLPIPRWEALAGYKPDHPLLAYLVGLIDGQRTLADLSRRMIEDHGARPDAALTGTRAMLSLVLSGTRPG